jgi:hypothetical protein
MLELSAGPVADQPACHAAGRCLCSLRRASDPAASSKSATPTGASTAAGITLPSTSTCDSGSPISRPELSAYTITVEPALSPRPANTSPMRGEPSGASRRRAPGRASEPGYAGGLDPVGGTPERVAVRP